MTGFRVLSNPVRAFGQIKNIRADTFKPEVRKFLSWSLSTAVNLTPQRNGNTIRAAQKKQYAHRVNYIPSYHSLENPTLIVNDDGEHWMFFAGKWYRPDIWNIPSEAWAAYEGLNTERERRLKTSEAAFIEQRTQARFLFKKTWWEIGKSAGVSVSCPAPATTSITRRKPPLNPPRGYAQERGGKDAYSIVIRNPFLDNDSAGGHSPLATSRYKDFNGQDIINRAMDVHRTKFDSSVAKKSQSSILNVLKRFL